MTWGGVLNTNTSPQGLHAQPRESGSPECYGEAVKSGDAGNAEPTHGKHLS